MEQTGWAKSAARRLAALYEADFGARPKGRFRISMKHLRQLADRRRLYPEDLQALEREVYELGYVLIDLETFCVVISQRTFSNYRRVNEDALNQ